MKLAVAAHKRLTEAPTVRLAAPMLRCGGNVAGRPLKAPITTHRQQAIAKRLVSYTGQRCRLDGHGGLRYTVNGGCVACLKARTKASKLAAKMAAKV